MDLRVHRAPADGSGLRGRAVPEDLAVQAAPVVRRPAPVLRGRRAAADRVAPTAPGPRDRKAGRSDRTVLVRVDRKGAEAPGGHRMPADPNGPMEPMDLAGRKAAGDLAGHRMPVVPNALTGPVGRADRKAAAVPSVRKAAEARVALTAPALRGRRAAVDRDARMAPARIVRMALVRLARSHPVGLRAPAVDRETDRLDPPIETFAAAIPVVADNPVLVAHKAASSTPAGRRVGNPVSVARRVGSHPEVVRRVDRRSVAAHSPAGHPPGSRRRAAARPAVESASRSIVGKAPPFPLVA